MPYNCTNYIKYNPNFNVHEKLSYMAYTRDSLVGAGSNGEKIASAYDSDVALWVFSNLTNS